MDAGRDLDALIAQRVMGLWVYHYDKGYAENCYYILLGQNLDPVVAWPPRAGERKTEAEAWADVPHYSTDIAAAMLVADHVCLTYRAGLELCRLPPSLEHGRESWTCQFFGAAQIERWPGGEVGTGAATREHAICLAALKACGFTFEQAGHE